MHPMDDMEGIRYIYNDTKEPTVITILLEGLELDVNLTATAGGVTYQSWVNTSDTHAWYRMDSEDLEKAMEMEVRGEHYYAMLFWSADQKSL